RGVSLASRNSQGHPANGTSAVPTISGDGRYIAFASDASDLGAGSVNGNNVVTIFLLDRLTGETTRASQSNSGALPNGDCDYPVISADGRFVAFESEASNLVPGDTNQASDVFVYDRVTSQLELISVS